MKKNIFHLILWITCVAGMVACHKKDFLDKKPSTDLVVPATLPDFQALLDKETIINETPVLGELSADNYYFSPAFWQNNLPAKEHNTHIWAPDIFQGRGDVDDWNQSYLQVFYANVVLDGLRHVDITPANEQQWNTIKGAALFIRGYAFYNVAQVFAPAYDQATADKDPGIPLRLTPGIDEISVRATVQQTYDQAIADITASINLLSPTLPSGNLNRPSRPAAFAALARLYLSMRMYDKAGKYADSCLQLYDSLINYNAVTIPQIFSKYNGEVIYESHFLQSSTMFKTNTSSFCMLDSTLFASYVLNDMRRTIFFTLNSNGLPGIRGSYIGGAYAFSGFATDEMFLVRAECAARAGNTLSAMNGLNALLAKRWKAGTFTPLIATSADDALNIILLERRKEMPFRGVRWTDIRRLNKEGAMIKPTRLLFNQQYQLAPNEPRYALPIPPDVITLSGMPQNPR